jgi:hypothetical protein
MFRNHADGAIASALAGRFLAPAPIGLQALEVRVVRDLRRHRQLHLLLATGDIL